MIHNREGYIISRNYSVGPLAIYSSAKCGMRQNSEYRCKCLKMHAFTLSTTEYVHIKKPICFIDIDLSLCFLFEMASSNFRRSKQDKLLEGTLNILKDNNKKLDVINKLMHFIDSLKILLQIKII